MATAPIIQTDRLTLRAHERYDFDNCCALWAEPRVTRYIGGRSSTPEEVWSRLMRYGGHWSLLDFGYFVIVETATGAFVGEAGLADFHRDITPGLGITPEAGWVLLPQFHRWGFAREAMTAILDWSDGAGHRRTVAMIDPDNTASLHLADALGYQQYARTAYKGAPMVLLMRER